MSGIGISWAICKSAPRSRQIAMPAPHHSVFTGRMPFLPLNQQRQSTEGNQRKSELKWKRSNGALQAPPPAPITMDSSSLGTRRRLGHDTTNATKALACARRRNDVTRCHSLQRYQKAIVLLLSYPTLCYKNRVLPKIKVLPSGTLFWTFATARRSLT